MSLAPVNYFAITTQDYFTERKDMYALVMAVNSYCETEFISITHAQVNSFLMRSQRIKLRESIVWLLVGFIRVNGSYL